MKDSKEILKNAGINQEAIASYIANIEKTEMINLSDEEVSRINFEEALHAARIDTKRVLAEADILAKRFSEDSVILPEHILVVLATKRSFNAAKIIAARPEAAGKNIVVIIPDDGYKYLSTNLYK